MRSERDEAHHYLLCSSRTLIETWALVCVFYKKYYGCSDMAKVLCILCTGSVVHIHLHEHIRTTSSCRLLFVLRTDMSMLFDSVIQHGIDGAHRQWCTLSYTMGDYHHVLSRLALCQWNICFPSNNGVWLLSSGVKSPSKVTMLPFHQLCVLL